VKYQIRFTIDGLGTHSKTPQGWLYEETDDLDYAIKARAKLSLSGGLVIRDDGAVLAPDNSWSLPPKK
jgi:hypothetical protein